MNQTIHRRDLLRLTACALTMTGASAMAHGADSTDGGALPHFLGISVADIDRCKAWYQQVFEVRETFTHDAAETRVSLLENARLVIELMQHQAGASKRELLPDKPDYLIHGLFKTGLFVPNLDDWMARLAAHGIRGEGEIRIDRANRLRNVFVLDPEGLRWQFFDRRLPPEPLPAGG